MISLGIALRKTIIGLGRPVVTEYDAFQLLRGLIQKGDLKFASQGQTWRADQGRFTTALS